MAKISVTMIKLEWNENYFCYLEYSLLNITFYVDRCEVCNISDIYMLVVKYSAQFLEREGWNRPEQNSLLMLDTLHLSSINPWYTELSPTLMLDTLHLPHINAW